MPEGTEPGATTRRVFDELTPALEERFARTLGQLRVGSEYGLVDIGTAIVDLAADMMFLADLAGVDFDACIKKGAWHYGAMALDADDVRVLGPREIVEKLDDIVKALDHLGTSRWEVARLAAKLSNGGILATNERELLLIAAIRDFFRAADAEQAAIAEAFQRLRENSRHGV